MQGLWSLWPTVHWFSHTPSSFFKLLHIFVNSYYIRSYPGHSNKGRKQECHTLYTTMSLYRTTSQHPQQRLPSTIPRHDNSCTELYFCSPEKARNDQQSENKVNVSDVNICNVFDSIFPPPFSSDLTRLSQLRFTLVSHSLAHRRPWRLTATLSKDDSQDQNHRGHILQAKGWKKTLKNPCFITQTLSSLHFHVNAYKEDFELLRYFSCPSLLQKKICFMSVWSLWDARWWKYSDP